MKLTSKDKIQIEKLLKQFFEPNFKMKICLALLPNKKPLQKLCVENMNYQNHVFNIALMIYNKEVKTQKKGIEND